MGTGKESVVSPEAKFAWPIEYDDAGKMNPAPAGSRFAGKAAVTDQDTTKRRRPTGPTMRAQVISLRRRGLLPKAIADVLNISDRRVKQLLKEAA